MLVSFRRANGVSAKGGGLGGVVRSVDSSAFGLGKAIGRDKANLARLRRIARGVHGKGVAHSEQYSLGSESIWELEGR